MNKKVLTFFLFLLSIMPVGVSAATSTCTAFLDASDTQSSAIGDTTDRFVAIGFYVPADCSLVGARVVVDKTGTPTGDLRFSIRTGSTNTNMGTVVVASSTKTNPTTLVDWVDIDFSTSSATLVAGQKYFLVGGVIGAGNATNYFTIHAADVALGKSFTNTLYSYAIFGTLAGASTTSQSGSSAAATSTPVFLPIEDQLILLEVFLLEILRVGFFLIVVPRLMRLVLRSRYTR